jgi:arginine deiminase
MDSAARTVSELNRFARSIDAGIMMEPSHTVIAVRLPHSRQTRHLDTILSMVDEDSFLVSAVHLHGCQAFRLSPDGNVAPVEDLFAAIAQALGLASIRVITTGHDDCTQHREQ